MSFDAILKNIGRHVLLSEEEQQDFCSLLSVKFFKKKAYLRNFYIDTEGIDHSFYFGIEDWWMSDMHSRINAVPSASSIIAVEDTEVFQIAQTDLEKFLKKVPALERFFRISYQYSIAQHQTKYLQQLHMSGEERYASFRKKYPQFDKRIPQKHIATYLGMTPEFFNTVRSKVIRNS